MKRLMFSLFVAVLIVGSTAITASAHDGAKSKAFKGSLEFSGLVKARGGSQFSLQPVKANKSGKRWMKAHPGDLAFQLTESTKFKGKGAAAFGEGSKASVVAKSVGEQLFAKKVTSKPAPPKPPKPEKPEKPEKPKDQTYLEFWGKATEWNSETGTLTVDWSDANDAARQWVSENGYPDPVFVRLSSETSVWREGGGMPQPGDAVYFQANAAEGELWAVKLKAYPPA